MADRLTHWTWGKDDRDVRFASATCSTGVPQKFRCFERFGLIWYLDVSCDSTEWPAELQTSQQKDVKRLRELSLSRSLDSDRLEQTQWNLGAVVQLWSWMVLDGPGLQQRRSPLAQILPVPVEDSTAADRGTQDK